MILGKIIFFQVVCVGLIFGPSHVLNLEATKMITTTVLTTATMQLFEF